MNEVYNKLIKNEIVLFLIVAGINTIFGFIIYGVLVYSGLSVMLAVLLSTIIGVLFNFKTYGSIVFKSNNNRLLFKFVGIYALCYIINVSGIYLLEKMQIDKYIAWLFMAVPIGILTYILNKKFVFNI
jgi:putative flippase GtrA